MEKNKTTNFDSPWKDIIEAFFPQFMEFFVPQSLQDIDFTKDVNFLDKELETKKDSSLRKQWKLELTKLLYEKGYSRKEVFNLFRFIDWILILPQKLNKIYYEEIKDLGGNKKMPYITDLEKYAMEKGFISGEIKKSQNVLIKQMNKKFKLSKKEEEIISNEFNPQILDKALDEILFADSKDAVLKFFK